MIGEEEQSHDNVIGPWRGMVTTQDSSYTLTVDLQHAANADLSRARLVGEGQLATEETGWDLTVDGMITNPNVSLTLKFKQVRPVTLQGTVDEVLETLEADIVGGPMGFGGESVTLEKQ